MQAFANRMIENISFLQGLPRDVVYLVVQFVFAAMVLMIFVAPFAGIISFVERRIAARMMSRVGPNRVGPQGVFQWIADGIKSLLKEDIIPSDADSALFRFAPYLVFAGMFAAFVAIPFSSALIIADLDVGIVFILAVTSLVVIGIMMSGWASNNKWSLLGGMRSAAQIISYEIPVGLSVLVVTLLAGTLSMQGIIKAQGAYPWQWFIFNNPFATVSFFIMFISALAEGNRTPFDLPEAESELVSGYNTEYSGMRFVYFFFEEWANLYLIAAVSTTLFLGGWLLPPEVAAWAGGKSVALLNLLQLAAFMIKALALVFVIIWIRWTLPRVRVDQLMVVCWKYFIPFGIASVLGTAVWILLFPKGSLFMNYFLLLIALVTIVYFFYRVAYQLWFTKSPIDLNPFV